MSGKFRVKGVQTRTDPRAVSRTESMPAMSEKFKAAPPGCENRGRIRLWARTFCEVSESSLMRGSSQTVGNPYRRTALQTRHLDDLHVDPAKDVVPLLLVPPQPAEAKDRAIVMSVQMPLSGSATPNTQSSADLKVKRMSQKQKAIGASSRRRLKMTGPRGLGRGSST